MKFNSLYCFLAALLAISCSKAVPEPEPLPEPTPAQQVYTMTVKASRAYTKALEEDTSQTPYKIVSTWSAGDVITVWTSDGTSKQYGELIAETSGSSTTFRGTLSSLPADGEELLLKYLSDDYSAQDGTLTGSAESIDKVSDYALATVTATVDGTSVTSTEASFVNQQAIVRFRLKDKNDFSDLNATGFSISINGKSYTALPASATNVFYLAIPGCVLDNVPLTLTATTGSKVYRFSHKGNFVPTSFENGKYYTVSVALNEYTGSGTIEWLKIKASFGENCSAWHGWYVSQNGTISSTSTSDAIGVIAYTSSSDVEVAAPGSRILVLSLESEGGDRASYQWAAKNAAETGFTDQSAMNGLAFCNQYHSEDYSAAHAAYECATARPEGATRWFLPSRGQLTAMMPTVEQMLRKESIHVFYWSSTYAGSGYAWCYLFSLTQGYDGWCTRSKEEKGDSSISVFFHARPCFAY